MIIRVAVHICLLLLLVSTTNSYANGFQHYSQEVAYLKTMLDCPQEKILSPAHGFGALYICNLTASDSVKLFVSEESSSDKVLNIGLLWNDWKTNVGYEIHSDLKEVEKTLNFLIDMYVPARREQISKAFWDSRSVEFNTPEFSIYFSHKAGPQKDQRLIVIEEQ